MSFASDPRQHLIVVDADVRGPNGSRALRLGFDTGSTETVVRVDIVAFLGYAFSPTEERNRLITASSIQFAPRVALRRILALGQERLRFPVLAYTLPAEIGVDGMLGLDFLRGVDVNHRFPKRRALAGLTATLLLPPRPPWPLSQRQ